LRVVTLAALRVSRTHVQAVAIALLPGILISVSVSIVSVAVSIIAIAVAVATLISIIAIPISIPSVRILRLRAGTGDCYDSKQ